MISLTQILLLLDSAQTLGFLAVGSAFYCISLVVYRLCFHPLARFPGPKLAAATQLYELYFEFLNGPYFTYLHQQEHLHDIYGPIVRINPDELHIRDPTWFDTLYAGPGHIRDKYQPAVKGVGVPLSRQSSLSMKLKMSDSLSVFGTVSHDEHRRRRRAINGFMAKQILRCSEDRMRECADLLCTAIRKQYGAQGYCEFRINFMAYATDVVSEFTLGKPFGLLRDEQRAKEWAITTGCIARMVRVIRHFGWLVPLVKHFMPLRLCRRVFPRLAPIVVLHHNTVRWAKETLQNFDDLSTAQAKCVQLREESPRERSETIFHEIFASNLPHEDKHPERAGQEAFTFLAAGGETTSRCLTVAMYYVLASPSVREKLEHELKAVMPNPLVTPEVKELERLPWLTACIRESLRIGFIFTTRSPLISPTAAMQYKDWTIPPGTPVSMTLGLVMLDPTVYDQPFVFRPERFLPNNPDYERNMSHFCPFSRGNRSCYGQK